MWIFVNILLNTFLTYFVQKSLSVVKCINQIIVLILIKSVYSIYASLFSSFSPDSIDKDIVSCTRYLR